MVGGGDVQLGHTAIELVNVSSDPGNGQVHIRRALRDQKTREEGAATRPAPQFGGRFEPVTDEQWNEVLPFVKDNFKNALAALDKMSDAGPIPRQARNKARIYAQVRDLRQLQDRDPERYQSRLEQAKLGDEIFGLVEKLRVAPRKEQGKLHQELRSKVRARVQAELEERERLIEKLTKQLDTQKKQLENDKLRLASDEELEKRVEFFVKSGNFFRGGSPGRLEGRGPGTAEGSGNAGRQP